MVRLVFRPYTHVWRTICTSVSLRSSTRVSPGFNLRKHSSPSFGSQHTCSSEYFSSEESLTADEEHLSVIIQSISLRLGVYNSRTRTYVRLLGPCFKTGRITMPWWRQDEQTKAEGNLDQWHRSTGNQRKKRHNYRRKRTISPPLTQYVPQNTCKHEELGVGKGKRTSRACYSLSPNDFTYFSHSFQIPFHLSLTVLVRYRSPGNI